MPIQPVKLVEDIHRQIEIPSHFPWGFVFSDLLPLAIFFEYIEITRKMG